MTTAILLSGGTGTRLGASVPKQYLEIHGKPIIFYSLKTLLCFPAITSLRIVAGKEWRDLILACVDELQGRDKLAGFSDPGENRQESIRNALEDICKLRSRNAEKEYVLIHDGARPFVTEDDLDKLKKELENEDGAILVNKTVDTIKEAKDGYIVSTPQREYLYNALTPQGFKTEVLKEAYRNVDFNGVTDDASVLEKYGKRVKIVEGSLNNKKLTSPEDFLEL